MSETNKSSEPPRAVRAEAPPPASASSGGSASGQSGGNAAAEAAPRAAAKAEAKPEPLQNLLEQMRKLAEQMPPDEREKMLKIIKGYVADGAKAGMFQNEIFRTRIAWAAHDIEKATGQPLQTSDTLRTELTDRAFTAPGLKNPDMLKLMRTTETLRDPALVRQIREDAIEVGKMTYPQLTPEIDNIVNRLRGQVVDHTASAGASHQQAASITGRHRGNETKEDQTAGTANTRVNNIRQIEQQAGGARQDQTAPQGASGATVVRVPTQNFLTGVSDLIRTWRDRPRPDNAAMASPEAVTPPPQSQAQPASPAPTTAAPARERQPGPSVASQPAETTPAQPAATPPNQGEARIETAVSPLSSPSAGTALGADAIVAPNARSTDSDLTKPVASHAAAALFGGFKQDPAEQALLDTRPPWLQNASAGEQFNRQANLVQDAIELRRLAPQIQKTDAAAQAAVEAVQSLLDGPASDIRGKITAAARHEAGGVNAVISEMSAEGKYAGLRGEFDSAMQNPRLASAYDATVMALDAYGKQRATLASKYDEIGRSKSEIGEHFDKADQALGLGISELPGKEAGQSMLNEIGQKFVEMYRQIVNTVRQAIGIQPTAAPNQTQSQGPRLSPG